MEDVTEASPVVSTATDSAPLIDVAIDSPAGVFDCASKGPCPNDPPPSQLGIDNCNQLLQDPMCGAEFQALGMCMVSAARCTPAGVSDEAADIAACRSQYNAFVSCKRPPTDSGPA